MIEIVDTQNTNVLYCLYCVIGYELGLVCCIAQAVTVNRIAKEWNQGLEEAREAVRAQNETLSMELSQAGVDKNITSKSLIPEPVACPEDLDSTFVRKYLRAFNWKKTSRNTSGNYLDFRQHVSWPILFYFPTASSWPKVLYFQHVVGLLCAESCGFHCFTLP